MSNRIFFLIGILPLFYFLLNTLGHADAVIFPSGNAAWTVTFSESQNGSGASGPRKHPTQIDVVQVNGLRRTHINWSDGTLMEKWNVPSLPVDFEEASNGTIDPNQSGSSNERSLKFAAPSEISAFSWVAPETLKEKEPVSYQGKQCFHYVGEESPGPYVPLQKCEAWIDSVTLLPVALDTGTSLAVFTFAPKPPTEPLAIPSKFKKEIDYYKILMGYH